MDKYDEKYGFDSGLEEVKRFHSQRRMFAIRDDTLFLAPKNVPYSHAKWFEKMGWINPEKDSLMDTITRGFLDRTGLYFYTGYEMKWSKKAEEETFTHLKELVNKLQIKIDLHLLGGMIRSKPGTKWPSEKDFGRIGELI
jgi:hypothetical protein